MTIHCFASSFWVEAQACRLALRRGPVEKGFSLSIALDPVSMLIDSAAHLWSRLERHASLDNRPQQSGLDTWLALGSTDALDAAELLQLRREYRRLCSLLDQLVTLLRDEPRALQAVRTRLETQPAPTL